MAQRFAGKVAWITGGGSGIGRALAVELARQGARVAVSGRRVDRLADAVRALEAEGVEALAVACDVRQDDAVRDAVAAVVARFGQLDVAVANAGFSVAGRVAKLSGDDWRRQLDTNVVGAALTARYALPELEKTAGRIGLVGSVSAFLCSPGFAAYSASKFALRALGLTLAAELHGTGVSCTLLHPGYVASEIAQVDNEGTFRAERQDKRPKLLMWPAEKAARVMARALSDRRRELVFTGHGKLGAFMGQHLPGLVHAALRRAPKAR
ncbi:MAG: SDR family NAD(P)-dependent oxidoreductase [Myxococcales bacterium]|nr:SDR family NAD(P)-dependent oxidoreductase [Myxococcales bacterium]